MFTVSAQDLLVVWEAGMNQHPLERTLTLLTLVDTNSKEELAECSIGQRNNKLLQLRKTIFGQSLACFVKCAFCEEALEFTLNLEDLNNNHHAVAAKKQIKIDKFTITFRAITSADLIAIKYCNELKQASQQLLQRCVLSCQHNRHAISVTQLPDSVIDILAKEMAAHDPQAELLFNIACFNCKSEWQAPFDIAIILWEEIRQKALQLLDEVHQLALAYGWQEAEILRLSPQRRQFYLNKLL